MALAIDPEIVCRLEAPEQFGGMVACSKYILAKVSFAGLCTQALLSPAQLGAHPSNRSNYGINEESVHKLGADILEVGWDADQLGQPIAVEEGPDGYITKYNIEMTSSSPALAPVSPLSIKAGTLTNGHLVLFLRALSHGAPSTTVGIAVDGKLSLAHVAEVSPGMAQASQEGWKWSLLHADTRKLYTDKLFQFLSDARNVNLNRAESEAQVFLKVCDFFRYMFSDLQVYVFISCRF